MKRLGERIKRKRENLQMRLNDLAKLVGISSSALSQIENAKAFPSIFNLKAIADGLNTTVGELIGENEALTVNPVIKYGDRKFVDRNKSGAKLYLLSHHGSHKLMETYAVIFPESADSTDIMTEHPGQGFIFVSEGNVEVLLNEKRYSLNKGDSFYFSSITLHHIQNIYKGTSELIWILTPQKL